MARRVAFVAEYCPPYRTGFYERMDERFDVRVFFCDHQESWQAYGDFDYIQLYRKKLRDRYAIAPSLFIHLWRYDPDVIVGGPVEGYGGQASYLYARATDTPYVLWTGEWHLPLTTLRTVTFPLIRRIYDNADAIAVYGPHIQNYLTDLGVDGEKISLAWNTVNTDKFADPGPEVRTALRKDWGISPDASVVIYVGRLVHEKGVKYLLEGFRAASERLDTEAHLLIVGDGDNRERLEAAAGDAENVTFTGYVENDDLSGYYALSDVFVLPSITTDVFKEPWGLVLNEAMSVGTAVVATCSVGAANAGLVKDGENGYIVPERNADAIANRLVSILSNSERAAVMGDRSREILANYDYSTMINGFEAAIEHACETE